MGKQIEGCTGTKGGSNKDRKREEQMERRQRKRAAAGRRYKQSSGRQTLTSQVWQMGQRTSGTISFTQGEGARNERRRFVACRVKGVK